MAMVSVMIDRGFNSHFMDHGIIWIETGTISKETLP